MARRAARFGDRIETLAYVDAQLVERLDSPKSAFSEFVVDRRKLKLFDIVQRSR
jgi:hypothetical protein